MQCDVVILGGGAAGLAAARDLTGAGKRVCLLEARDRLGGRMHTLHLAGVPMPIELGAEFVHGASQTAFSIVDAAGLILHQLPDVHWWSREGSLQIIDDYWKKMERLRTQIGGTNDQSFADFLRGRRGVTARLRELALGYVEGYHAAHADRISAQSIASSDEEQSDSGGNQQFRIANGYDSVVSWLRAGITPERAEVRTATTALEVRWRDGEVVVRCRGTRGGEEEEIQARAAVITLPIGVLKAPPEQPGALRFTPELREKRRVLERLEIGHVVKIVFRFRERFWDAPSFLSERASASDQKNGPVNFLHSSDRWIPTWWTTAPVRTPMLTAWAGGHAADRLLAEGEESMVDRALDSMTKAFRMERRTLDGLLAGAHLHNWQSDPFSRGAYSYSAVGGSEAPRQLARPVKSTLFFAGEATNAEETGTVMGAIDSGRRAAKEVLARLK